MNKIILPGFHAWLISLSCYEDKYRKEKPQYHEGLKLEASPKFTHETTNWIPKFLEALRELDGTEITPEQYNSFDNNLILKFYNEITEGGVLASMFCYRTKAESDSILNYLSKTAADEVIALADNYLDSDFIAHSLIYFNREARKQGINLGEFKAKDLYLNTMGFIDCKSDNEHQSIKLQEVSIINGFISAYSYFDVSLRSLTPIESNFKEILRTHLNELLFDYWYYTHCHKKSFDLDSIMKLTEDFYSVGYQKIEEQKNS